MMLQSAPVILLVEDDAITRNLVCELLRLEGFTVVMAANGFQALATLETRAVSLVLCDLELPGLSGLGVLAELRARETAGSRAPIPFVLMSGRAVPPQAAVDGFLPKPFDADQLVALIHSRLAVAQAAV